MCTRPDTCQCRAECSSPWCVAARFMGRQPCGVRAGEPHPVTGSEVKLTAGRCRLCHDAYQRKIAHAAKIRERLIAPSRSGEPSLFSLVAGGEAG